MTNDNDDHDSNHLKLRALFVGMKDFDVGGNYIRDDLLGSCLRTWLSNILQSHRLKASLSNLSTITKAVNTNKSAH